MRNSILRGKDQKTVDFWRKSLADYPHDRGTVLRGGMEAALREIDALNEEVTILQNAVEDITNMEPIMHKVDPIQYMHRVDEIGLKALNKLKAQVSHE